MKAAPECLETTTHFARSTVFGCDIRQECWPSCWRWTRDTSQPAARSVEKTSFRKQRLAPRLVFLSASGPRMPLWLPDNATGPRGDAARLRSAIGFAEANVVQFLKEDHTRVFVVAGQSQIARRFPVRW
jgi:hypothetical protein